MTTKRMTAGELLAQAAADGVSVTVEPPRTLLVGGPENAIRRWLPDLRSRAHDVLHHVEGSDEIPPCPSGRVLLSFLQRAGESGVAAGCHVPVEVNTFERWRAAMRRKRRRASRDFVYCLEACRDAAATSGEGHDPKTLATAAALTLTALPDEAERLHIDTALTRLLLLKRGARLVFLTDEQGAGWYASPPDEPVHVRLAP